MTSQSNAKATAPTNVTTVTDEENKIKKINYCFQVTLTTSQNNWTPIINLTVSVGLNFSTPRGLNTRKKAKRVLVDVDEIDGYEVSQSTLQVYLTRGPQDQQSRDKLIIVHVYHTYDKKPSVRTVLVQGSCCPQWARSQTMKLRPSTPVVPVC